MIVMLLLFVKIPLVSKINFKFYSSTIVEFYFKEAINAMVVNSVTLVLVSHVLTKTNVQDEFVTSLKILIASILKFGLQLKGIPGDSILRSRYRVGWRSVTRDSLKYQVHFSYLTCENRLQEAMSVIAETTLIWTRVTLETVVGDQSHERYIIYCI